jgi:NitT/TauT family transport system ATP-binding protein
MTVSETSMSPGVPEEDHQILFDSVTKTYGEGDSKVTACQDLDFSIGSEEFVSVVGPSGCGKSTLLHMTSSLLEPSEGNVYINGVDTRSSDFERTDIGLVFQEPVLLDWRTVKQNIMLPVKILGQNGNLDRDKEFYRDRADELIQKVGLEGFEDSYPKELSGGMQQRVAICRSLIYNPSILLMDEPFGALDAFTRNKLNSEILDIWKETNKSVLFVTHNLEEAVFLSDRVIVLSPRPGRIIDDIDIDLPRPRNEETRTSDRFQELSGDVYDHFKDIMFGE